MKDVRFFFIKDGSARFISHLDTYRCMLRALHRTHLPIWYTEGFNRHPFITFSLPLPLGIRGLNESFDVRLTDDIKIDSSVLIDKLNLFLPNKLGIISFADPLMKPNQICYADFKIIFADNKLSGIELFDKLSEIFNQKSIYAIKKSKSGDKQINLKEHIKKFNAYYSENGQVCVELILPAGNTFNINPFLFTSAIDRLMMTNLFYDITRISLLDENLQNYQ